MARQGYHYGNLKEKAVETAFRMQSNRVTDIVGVREVARELGVNHGALNRHFGNRASFLRHVAVPIYAALRDSLSGAIKNRRLAKSKLTELAVAFQKFSFHTPGLLLLIMDADVTNTDDEELLAHYSPMIEVLNRLIEEGQSNGEIEQHSAADIAYVVWVFMLGYWENNHAQRDFDGTVPTDQNEWREVEAHFRRTFDIVLKGFCIPRIN